jgi:hypothetical protein
MLVTTVAGEISSDLARETRTDRGVSQGRDAVPVERMTRERRSC